MGFGAVQFLLCSSSQGPSAAARQTRSTCAESDGEVTDQIREVIQHSNSPAKDIARCGRGCVIEACVFGNSVCYASCGKTSYSRRIGRRSPGLPTRTRGRS